MQVPCRVVGSQICVAFAAVLGTNRNLARRARFLDADLVSWSVCPRLPPPAPLSPLFLGMAGLALVMVVLAACVGCSVVNGGASCPFYLGWAG